MSIWTSSRLSEQGAGRGDSQTSTVFSLVMTTDGLELKCEQVRSISSLPRMLWGLRMGRLGHSWSYQTCKWGSIKVPTVDNFAYKRRDWGGKKVRKAWHNVVGNASNLPGSRVCKFLTVEGGKSTLFSKHLTSRSPCSIKYSTIPNKTSHDFKEKKA